MGTNGDMGRTVANLLKRFTFIGRTLTTWPMNGIQGQQRWDVRGMAPGTYVVQYLAEGQVLHTERLVVQQ